MKNKIKHRYLENYTLNIVMYKFANMTMINYQY